MLRRRQWGKRLTWTNFCLIVIAGLAVLGPQVAGSAASGGAVVSSLSLESGQFAGHSWVENGLQWPIQCNFQFPLSDCAAAVSDVVRSGSKSLRVTVAHGDSAYGWQEQTELTRPIPNDGQSDGYHQYHAVAPDEGAGDDYWYHLSVKFGIKSPAGAWRIFWEWHAWAQTSPPLSFSYNFDDLQMSLNAGQLVGDSGLPMTSRSQNALAPGKGLAINVPFGLNRPGQRGMLNQWHDILVHVKWTPFPNQGGLVEVYHKYADESAYQKVIDIHSTSAFPGGIPTMQATSLDEKGNPSVRPITNYMLLGYYRKSYCTYPVAPTAWKDPAACGSTTGIQPTDTVWLDDFAQGTTRDSVDGGAPITEQPAATSPAPPSSTSTSSGTTSTAINSTFRAVTDRGCVLCNVSAAGDALDATIQGGRDDLDTAYAAADIGGSAGLSGRTYVRDVVRLPRGAQLGANLAFLQLRGVNGGLIYELYADSDRVVHLWSPPGGLRAAAINESTGVTIPNDGTTSVRMEVSAAADDSVIVRANGQPVLSVSGLSGGTKEDARYLDTGIDHYDTSAVDDGVSVYHSMVGASVGGWLGDQLASLKTLTDAPASTTATTTTTTASTASSSDSPDGPSPAGPDLPTVAGMESVTAPQCMLCSVSGSGPGVAASIQGGRDSLDTAFAMKDFGGAPGWTGRTFLRDDIRLASGQKLGSNLALVQMRDTSNALIYELYADSDRILHLWSPAGGLRASVVNESTGVAVPNDGSRVLRVEVSSAANGSVVIRIDGVDRLTVSNLSGATTGNSRYLRAGIDHYDTHGTGDTATAYHSALGVTTRGWLGDRGAASGASTAPTTQSSSGNPPSTVSEPATSPGTGSGSSPNANSSSPTAQSSTSQTSSSPTGQSGQQTLGMPDPGFESDPSSDYYFVADGGKYSWATDEAHSGSRSLKVVSTTTGMTRWMSVTTRIAAQAGTRYSATAWLKTSGGSANISMTFWGPSCANGYCGSSSSEDTSGDWQRAMTTETAPRGTTSVRIEFRLNGIGTLWADDADLSST